MYLGAFTASTQPVYGEIRRSSFSRRDTSFFIRVPRYVILYPRAEIRFDIIKLIYLLLENLLDSSGEICFIVYHPFVEIFFK